MFKNYLITSFRNIKKHNVFSIVNIIGLAVGMAICLMIMLYVQSELTYDRFYKDYDKVFRIQMKFGELIKEGKTGDVPQTPAMLKEILAGRYPNIKSVTRILTGSSIVGVKYKDDIIKEKDYLRIEPSFFDIFDHKFEKGNKETAMNDPNSIVITQSFSEKYFGNSDPINKILSINGKDFRVTSVVKDAPKNSHLKFDFLLPLVINEQEKTVWDNNMYLTYIKTDKPEDYGDLKNKITDLTKYYVSEQNEDKLTLIPLKDIHFGSNLLYPSDTDGNTNYLYGLISLGVLVLLLACVNFMNLSTARSTVRAGEIGLRKIIGAGRYELIRQFLIESLGMSFIALVFSILIAAMVYPLFNKLVDADINISQLGNIKTMAMMAMLWIVTGILAGSYPAFVLSSFKPIKVLKKSIAFSGNNGKMSIRKTLIILQFIICSFLITGMLIVGKQMDFVFNKDLGYKREQVIVIPIADYKTKDVLKSELKKSSFVQSASLSSYPPDMIATVQNYFCEDPQNKKEFAGNAVDADFVKTYDIKLIEGRFIDESAANDEYEQYVLNETAVKAFGLSNPVGMKMGRGKTINGEIVGVVKDFNFMSLREKIGPLVLSTKQNGYNYLSLKINSSNIMETLDEIKAKYKTVVPNKAFDYYFLDEHFTKLYSKDIKLTGIITTFTTISIVIACLGLFGLVTFAIEKRKKEIGIRKVLGAETKNIASLVIKEFIALIVFANIAACPVAYFVMSDWLKDYAYKTEISWWIFPAAMLASLLISAITIGFQTVKAATANPVDSIRYE